MWIFGWDRLPKKVAPDVDLARRHRHLLSAIFILAANSWMQTRSARTSTLPMAALR